MDDIRLPMIHGTMEDISQEAESEESQHTGDSFLTPNAREIYEKEAHIKINYDKMDDDYKDVSII